MSLILRLNIWRKKCMKGLAKKIKMKKKREYGMRSHMPKDINRSSTKKVICFFSVSKKNESLREGW